MPPYSNPIASSWVGIVTAPYFAFPVPIGGNEWNPAWACGIHRSEGRSNFVDEPGVERGHLSVMWKTVSGNWFMAAVLLAMTGPTPAIGQETTESAGASVGLAGDWSLNRALSDDPDDQLRDVRGGARPPGGRSPGGGGRPPDASPLDVIRRAVEAFSIRQTDSTVAIAYPDRELSLLTNGRKQKIQVAEDLEVEYRAWWEQDHLFIERKLDRGITLTEEYSSQAGTGRLHVLTRLEGDRLPRTIAFMRVYDPASADS